MRGSRKLCPTLTVFLFFSFLFDQRRENPNSTIIGPALARQQNAIEGRYPGGPVMALHQMLTW